jgi:hypothetical protein
MLFVLVEEIKLKKKKQEIRMIIRKRFKRRE